MVSKWVNNPNIPHLYVGYNPFTNNLQSSRDIQVVSGAKKMTFTDGADLQDSLGFVNCSSSQMMNPNTLPETNSAFTPENGPKPKSKGSSSNHQFSFQVRKC